MALLKQKINGTWSVIPLIGTSSSLRGDVEILNDNTASIQLPFSISNAENLKVHKNGVLLVPNIHYNYNIVNSTIDLIDFTASAGDLFSFINN